MLVRQAAVQLPLLLHALLQPPARHVRLLHGPDQRLVGPEFRGSGVWGGASGARRCGRLHVRQAADLERHAAQAGLVHRARASRWTEAFARSAAAALLWSDRPQAAAGQTGLLALLAAGRAARPWLRECQAGWTCARFRPRPQADPASSSARRTGRLGARLGLGTLCCGALPLLLSLLREAGQLRSVLLVRSLQLPAQLRTMQGSSARTASSLSRESNVPPSTRPPAATHWVGRPARDGQQLRPGKQLACGLPE